MKNITHSANGAARASASTVAVSAARGIHTLLEGTQQTGLDILEALVKYSSWFPAWSSTQLATEVIEA